MKTYLKIIICLIFIFSIFPGKIFGKASDWIIYNNSPLLVPSLNLEGDNIYAPDVHKEGNLWKMWYGGQVAWPQDGHDRIFYATSTDGINWNKYGVVLERSGLYQHDPDPWPYLDNDPSVVQANGVYYMYYTETDIVDRIMLATSPDGINWQKKGIILDVTSNEWGRSWTSRPSALYENGVFKLWYDSKETNNEWADVGYATSTDGIHFQKYSQNPVLKGVAGVDVKHIGDKYFLVYENSDGIHWAISNNETDFVNQGVLFNKLGSNDDKYGLVSPMIFFDEANQQIKIYYGGASNNCLCHNRIFMAYTNISNLPLLSPTPLPTISPTLTQTPIPTIKPSPTNQPTITSTPSPTTTVTCVPYNNSTKTTLNNFSIWRSEYISGNFGTVSKTTWNADFDCDHKITLNDFSIWRVVFLKNINGS